MRKSLLISDEELHEGHNYNYNEAPPSGQQTGHYVW